jgi:hypothetical protein
MVGAGAEIFDKLEPKRTTMDRLRNTDPDPVGFRKGFLGLD